jgi:hypothetical protein
MPRLASLASARLSSVLLATASILTAAACSEVEEGRYGIVDFVPQDCGNAYCTFDDDLAIGATTDVWLSGNDGQYVDDLEIVSSNPFVVDVVGRDGGAPARFTIEGTGTGRADLIAIDRYGDEVDYISIDVAPVRNVDFWVTGGDVRGPDDIVVGGVIVPRYAVAAGTRVEIVAHPDGMLGEMSYDVVLPSAIRDRLDGDSNLGRGKVVVSPPAGEHELRFRTEDGRSWPVQISAR